jgi:hypothetical protein
LTVSNNTIAAGATLASAITTGTTFTFSAWIYQITTPSYGNLFAQASILGLWMSNGKIDYYYATDHLSSGVVGTGGWNHVAVVNSGGNVTYYINGTADPNTYTLGISFDANGIGCDSGISEECSNGYLDDIRLYNRALSSTDITELYNYGATTGRTRRTINIE